MFVPLYDYVGKVFAVGFAWTCKATRILRGRSDGSFMAAMADCIMAEVSRGRVVSGESAARHSFETELPLLPLPQGLLLRLRACFQRSSPGYFLLLGHVSHHNYSPSWPTPLTHTKRYSSTISPGMAPYVP